MFTTQSKPKKKKQNKTKKWTNRYTIKKESECRRDWNLCTIRLLGLSQLC